MTLLDIAVELDGHGMSVVPVANDGSKRPHVSWKHFQTVRPDRRDLDTWFGLADFDGLGVVTGEVSGNLELLEVEGRAAHLAQTLVESLIAHGAVDLAQKLVTGWVESSPSGGMHWFYRVDGPARGNTKLARRRNPDNPRLVDVLVETRGEGGFVVVAPSAGRAAPKHGTSWARIAGGPATVPTLTVDERDMLHALATLLDEMPAVISSPSGVEERDYAPSAARPGDDFNARATWQDILEPHGWTRVRQLGDGFTWTRPGKDRRDGISATTGQSKDGVDRLYVFSTSTEFEAERPYTKFGAYALLEHGGDHAAAARQLRRDGYGADRPRLEVLQGGADWRPDYSTMRVIDEPVANGVKIESLPEWERELLTGGASINPVPDPQSLFDRDVEAKAYELRVIEAARDLLAQEKAGAAPPFDHGTLADILNRPEEPPHRVDGLIPTGASTLIVAMRKTGKTTLTLGLARHLIEGGEFLGRFPTRPLDGRVALLNYEVSAAQIGRWADECGVPHDRFILVNLRGRRNPLRNPDDRLALAQILRDQEVEACIVDPFGRAFGGRNQNDAAEVGSWLVDLDQFSRAEVGATEVVLTAHAGWEGERTRGSSALEDWPDVTITMTRDEEDNRFIAAEGRDIMLDEDQIEYDKVTREIVLTGSGSRKHARDARRIADLATAVVEVVADCPGLNQRQVTERLKAQGVSVGARGSVGKAARIATESGHIRQEHGPQNSTLYYPRLAEGVSSH